MSEKPVASSLDRKLQGAFAPIHLEIKDDSARHQGHAGHDGRGESHFIVTIVSVTFEGLNLVERHRLVYQVLEQELKERVHALRLTTQTPEEYNLK